MSEQNADHHEENAGHEAAGATGGHGRRGESLFSKVIALPETVLKGTWKVGSDVVKGTFGWGLQLIRGVTWGSLYGTLGTAVFGPVVDTAKHAAKTVKDLGDEIEAAKHDIENSRHIAKAGALIKGIILTTGKSVANALSWPLHLAGGAATRVTEGGSIILDSVLGKYDEHHKKDKASPEPAAGPGHPLTPAHA